MSFRTRTCLSLFDQADIGLLLIDPNGKILTANPAFCAMIGVAATELQNTSLLTLLPKESHPRFTALLAAHDTDAGPRFVSKLERFRDPQGGVHWGVLTWTWVVDADQTPQHAVLIVQDLNPDRGPLQEEVRSVLKLNQKLQSDLTEQQQMLKELGQMKRALDYSSCSVIILNREMVVEYVNPRFTAITGYTEEEVIGQPLALLKGDRWSTDFEGKKETLGEGREWRGEFRNRRKDGSLYFEFAIISPVLDETGAISHYISINEDITDRKAVEELLNRTMSESVELSKQLELTNAMMREQRTELKKANRRLGEMAKTDGLTHLLNHRTIMDTFKRRLAKCRKANLPLSVLMLDLDNFKRINDTYGHQTGDEVLSAVSGVVQGAVRDGDLAGRYGGEEFMVVFANATLEQARAAADRIRQRVSELRFSEDFTMTTSGGLSSDCGQTPIALIEEADQRLYEAKHAGKNRIVG
jgi:diguanylate cyclase (GGDEF)-like protein/PAS domain S-box-containing protein